MSRWLSGSSPWLRYSRASSVVAPLVMASQASPAMPPSLGRTNSTPVPFWFRIVVPWCHIGAIPTSQRSRSVRSVAGTAWIDDTLARSDFTASNPGSMLPSSPPRRRANESRVTVPSVLAGVLSPIRPLYSGFHRSAHDSGRTLSFLLFLFLKDWAAPVISPIGLLGRLLL